MLGLVGELVNRRMLVEAGSAPAERCPEPFDYAQDRPAEGIGGLGGAS
ncbi:MAG: hypothetical protein H8D78_17475 [Chloroflexi bacterium]|nr:hypothetical protein [Chloroflexota bacterium]